MAPSSVQMPVTASLFRADLFRCVCVCVCGRLARSILTHRHTEREGSWVRRSPRTTALTMLHRVSLIVASVRNQAARIARTCSPDPLPQQTATTPGEMGESKTKLLCPNYARFDHFVLQCGRKTRVVPGEAARVRPAMTAMFRAGSKRFLITALVHSDFWRRHG